MEGRYRTFASSCWVAHNLTSFRSISTEADCNRWLFLCYVLGVIVPQLKIQFRRKLSEALIYNKYDWGL